MNGLIIFLIIFIIIIILALIGVAIWYYYDKKKKEPTPGGGDTGGNNNNDGNGGNEGGFTGPNVVSFLLDSRSYNANDILQFNSIQGTNTSPMGSISGGIWTAGVTGTYLIFADATNKGGGGSISILKGNTILGTQLSLDTFGQTSLVTMGFANLVPGDKLEVKTLNQISIIDPDPKINATSHFIIERILPQSSVLYLTDGGSIPSNSIVPFNRTQEGTDSIGSISNGTWTPTMSGTYLIFADATNNGGGGSLDIISGNNTIGTGFKTVIGTAGQSNNTTVTTMGVANLNIGDSISVRTPSGMVITTPNPSTELTCHFLIQKVDTSKIVSYIFSSTQPMIAANSVLQFSQLQGVSTDPLGTMNNGTWTCTSPGKYLFFADATNDGGGGELVIMAANITIGTGYFPSSTVPGNETILTMGYAQLNPGDNVVVVTKLEISITNPDPSTSATSHLIIYKIN